jgi:hypothetical protein
MEAWSSQGSIIEVSNPGVDAHRSTDAEVPPGVFWLGIVENPYCNLKGTVTVVITITG